MRGLHNLGKYERDGAGIYHARYCTSGGDHQPVYSLGRALIFNGVIDMGTKEEMEERHCVDMATDNDAELALLVPDLLVEEYLALDFIDGLTHFIDNPKITFAGLIIDKNQFIAIRNEGRPLWMFNDIHGDCCYLASTLDIFKRADPTIKTMYCQKLKPLHPYIWHI